MKSVIDYLAKTVSLYPKKIAVVDNTESITFEQLWNNAQCISLNISTLGGG